MSKPSNGAAATSDGLDWLGRPIVIGFRISMIEQAARMELSIDLALAIYHARSADTAYSLYSEILWRVPLGVRIDQLGWAMDDIGLTDAYPFVIPVARKVIEARHIMAHSVAWQTDEGVVVYGRNRGRSVERVISHEYLLWLTREAERCVIDLDRVAAQIGDWRVWASLQGFDDRSGSSRRSRPGAPRRRGA